MLKIQGCVHRLPGSNDKVMTNIIPLMLCYVYFERNAIMWRHDVVYSRY